LLTEKELAEKLGVSVGTIRHWRYSLQGPPVRKVVRSVRYSVAEVEAWLDEQQDPWWRDG
jgi:predicted DNA-binding transcriptional regulator AlpA